jgi:hypothetical protein
MWPPTWERLHELDVELGHEVEFVEPIEGLPDMVFSANGSPVVDGVVLLAKFRHTCSMTVSRSGTSTISIGNRERSPSGPPRGLDVQPRGVGCLAAHRRLAGDYERRPEHAKAMGQVAHDRPH